MKRDTWRHNRPYKLEHQVLAIKAVDFETQTLIGFVDMTIHPLSSDIKHIFINCQQCLIHRVSIDEIYEPHFTYHDPTLNISPDPSKKYNMEYFASNHHESVCSSDIDSGGGELMIVVPNAMRNNLIDLKPFRLIVEFSLNRPKGGVQFVVPDTDGTLLERGAHMFTYNSHNSSRLWFPCMDSFSEVCTWKMEFTVDMYMVAVSCGNLLETIYTPDLRRKTYHYYLPVPTAAPHIALSIGPFEIWVDPRMHEVTNFCLPGLLPVLKHATSFLHEVFELYEELLSIRFPYSCYKQVFVDCAYDKVSSYATMSICSYSLLHSKRVIEQTILTRSLLAEAVANQFFGCYVSMNSWCDSWLTHGLSFLLFKTYSIKTFSNNVHLHHIAKTMEELCAYERQHGPVVLHPGWGGHKAYPQLLSTDYLRAHKLKSHLVMRMLEMSVGRQFMLQVMIKMLTLAAGTSKQNYPLSDWSYILVSTHSFLNHIFNVTGKDIQPFINQWVYQGGHVEIKGTFSFNRKRNIIELEVKQENTGKNSMKYVGPISAVVQELDGSFAYEFLIEDNKCKFDIACHSKSRRQKKKKIPIRTGEEIDINFADTDEDSPVLWLRIDAEMSLIRVVRLEQADFMWQLMLRHEKCVVYQLEAIKALEKFPSQKTQHALLHAVQQPRFFYKVREEACFCLAKVLTHMGLTNLSSMTGFFLSLFKAPCCPTIVRRNNFSNFKLYFLQKSFVLAISKLRDSSGKCPAQVLHFLRDLLCYNDNSINKFTDSYYKAVLIEALVNTVSPSISINDKSDGTRHIADGLANNIRLILQDVTRLFNMDKLIPSYHSVVTVSSLKAFRLLQRLRHLPKEQGFLKSHARAGMFQDVRLAALEALVDIVAVDSDNDTYNFLLDLMADEKDPHVRYKVAWMMAFNLPFKEYADPLNSASNKEKLWELINCKTGHDSRLRITLVDLFRLLYSKCKEVNDQVFEKKKKKESKFNPILDVCSIDKDQSIHSNHSSDSMDKRDVKFPDVDLYKSNETQDESQKRDSNQRFFSQISSNQNRLSLTQPSKIPPYVSDLSAFMVDDEYDDDVIPQNDNDVKTHPDDDSYVPSKKSRLDDVEEGSNQAAMQERDLTLSESSSPGNKHKSLRPSDFHNSGINLSEEEDEEEDESSKRPTFYNEDSEMFGTQESNGRFKKGGEEEEDEDDDDDFEEVADDGKVEKSFSPDFNDEL